jgi:hypothetical protein
MKKNTTLLIILAVIIVGVYFISGSSVTLPKNLSDHFSERMNTIGISVIGGVPIEGFDADTFMRAFPELDLQDFDGVQAFQGIYRFTDNKLEFEKYRVEAVHSAQKTISADGMKTLLSNLSKRLKVDLVDQGSIDMIIKLIQGPLPL